MEDLPSNIIRVCPEHMCRILASEKLLERAESGEFRLVRYRRTPRNPPFVDDKGQNCVWNEEWLIVDDRFEVGHDFHEVARLHRMITDKETVGCSGLMDPKEITIDGNNYHLFKKKEPRCELCEGGDMIPPENRFKYSTYRPGASTPMPDRP